MEKFGNTIKLTVWSLLILTSTTFAQQGTTYAWENPVTTNWWNPINWTPNGVPDSKYIALIANINPAITTILVDPDRVVRILVLPDGQQNMITGGSLPQQFTIADSLRMWGEGFSGNLTVFLPDTSFCKITGAGEKIIQDSSHLITEGESRWEGGTINCPDNTNAGWINRGMLYLVPEFFGDLSMGASFRNESTGVMIKTFSAHAKFRNSFGNTFENYGHIDIQEGLLWLQATSTVSGTISISSSGDFNLEGNNNNTLSDVTITGPGAVRLNGDWTDFNGNNIIEKLRLEGGRMRGPGSLTITDSLLCLTNTTADLSIITIEPLATLILDGALQTGSGMDTLNLNGQTIYTVNGGMGGDWDVNIINRGTIDFSFIGQPNGQSLGPSNFVNDSSGIININIPSGNNVQLSPGNFTNYGDVTLWSGTMQLNTNLDVYSGQWTMGANTLVNFINGDARWHAGSEIHANGTIQQQGGGHVLNLFGKVLPGGYAIGQLTIRPNFEAKLAVTSALIIQLGGTTAGSEYDQLIVDNNPSFGVFEIDGTLDVLLYNSFAPALGDTFDIILHNDYTGVFADTLLPVLPDPGLGLEVIYENSMVRLAVVIGPTAIEDTEDEENIPRQFSLFQNYPNPFNPQTTIRYGLPKTAGIKIEVFNSLGQLVATLVDRQQPAGFHSINWDASTQSSGIYFYRIQAQDFVQNKKMVLLR